MNWERQYESIQQAIDLLALNGAGFSVITFHSLEDRLTKQLFKEASTIKCPQKVCHLFQMT